MCRNKKTMPVKKTFFNKKKVINIRLNYLSISLDDASDPPGNRVHEGIQVHNAEVLVAQAAVGGPGGRQAEVADSEILPPLAGF